VINSTELVKEPCELSRFYRQSHKKKRTSRNSLLRGL
jgi:hypothetical protein